MKIAVVGLGAVGGLLAARLAQAGHTVCGLARGATLEAVRERGLRVRTGAASFEVPIGVSDDAAVLGWQDLVVVAVKATALADAAPALAPLFGPTTLVLPAMNGVPWWFLRAAPVATRLADTGLASIDPAGRVAAALPLSRVLGGVVHLTCTSPEPGLVQHGFGNRLIVGEPSGGESPRTDAVCAALAEAGFDAEASVDIRRDIWFKLWGNLTMNPVSALTGASTDRILDDPLVHAFILRSMSEVARIGAGVGCGVAQSGEERLALTRQLGGFKTSMLQDTLAGRPLELDALVGAVREIGLRLGIETPNIDALLGLARLMARERGLYPPAAAAQAA